MFCQYAYACVHSYICMISIDHELKLIQCTTHICMHTQGRRNLSAQGRAGPTGRRHATPRHRHATPPPRQHATPRSPIQVKHKTCHHNPIAIQCASTITTCCYCCYSYLYGRAHGTQCARTTRKHAEQTRTSLEQSYRLDLRHAHTDQPSAAAAKYYVFTYIRTICIQMP